MSHIDRPDVFERILIDIAGDLVATSERFNAREADYRANRDRALASFAAHDARERAKQEARWAMEEPLALENGR